MTESQSLLLHSYQLEHLPPGYTLHATLFTSLSNATFLHQQLLDGNSDFEFAFIDAAAIISRRHVLAAAFRAVNDLIEGRLKSRNVHSEMVFCLSGNNNIANSFRTFGLTPSTTNLVILKLSSPSAPFSAAAVQAHLSTHVQGTQVPFDDETLARYTDWLKVEKAYKLTSGGISGRKKKGSQNETSEGINGVYESGNKSVSVVEKKEIEMRVWGAMALRGLS